MNIIDLPAGACVPGPGLYRTPLEHYHSQAICPGPSVSSSGLRRVFSESPWAFWSQSEMNPNRYPEETRDHLSLGSAAHALILGDEVWEDNYAVRPVEFNSWQTKASKEWREAQQKAGKTVVTPDQVITIGYMAENLAASPEARAALVSEHYEVSMIWQDALTGLWVKSRVDALPTNGYDFADLKTFAPQMKDIQRAVMKSVTDYRYDMQMALGLEGAEQLGFGSAQECALIFAQTTKPFNVVTLKINYDTLYWARVCNRSALNTIAKCIEEDHWPMPVEGILEYSLPPSLLARYADMQISGELPNLEN